MNQINKMWLACSKDNYESYPGHKIKNAFKCTLKELTIKCIFKGLVGLRTPSNSLQHSHDTRHVEISCVGIFVL